MLLFPQQVECENAWNIKFSFQWSTSTVAFLPSEWVCQQGFIQARSTRNLEVLFVASQGVHLEVNDLLVGCDIFFIESLPLHSEEVVMVVKVALTFTTQYLGEPFEPVADRDQHQVFQTPPLHYLHCLFGTALIGLSEEREMLW